MWNGDRRGSLATRMARAWIIAGCKLICEEVIKCGATSLLQCFRFFSKKHARLEQNTYYDVMNCSQLCERTSHSPANRIASHCIASHHIPHATLHHSNVRSSLRNTQPSSSATVETLAGAADRELVVFLLPMDEVDDVAAPDLREKILPQEREPSSVTDTFTGDVVVDAVADAALCSCTGETGAEPGGPLPVGDLHSK